MQKKDQKQQIGYFPSNRKPRKGMFYAALAVCAGIFVVCLALLINYYASIAASRAASEQLSAVYNTAVTDAPILTAPPVTEHSPTATLVSTPAPTTQPQAAPAAAASATEPPVWPSIYPDNPKLAVSTVFDQLQAQNRDIVAWIKIDGLLEEPVVQRDNSYYLTHNALRQESLTGALFLDENCNLITVPTQMVVHGHNMKEGAMFGSLKLYKLKGASFYHEHAYIDFNTLYENSRYVIFAIAEVDIRSDRQRYLPFWLYSRFPSVKVFSDYVERSKMLSELRCSVDVQPGDRILTLSTCSGDDDNQRLLIMARKLRDDEDMLALNIAVQSTYNK